MAWAIFDGMEKDAAVDQREADSRSSWSLAGKGAEAALDRKLRLIGSPASLFPSHSDPSVLSAAGRWLNELE
jgi:hypothetical protein